MTDGGPAEPPDARPDARGALLWATALQDLANHVAHDFRNALNGVAVNLEVVRGRTARGAESSAIAPFAAIAAAQFESASAAAEALLGFTRPEPGYADVRAIVARLVRLTAVRADGALGLSGGGVPNTQTSAPADAVRAAVARCVLSALGAGAGAACEITVDDGIFLRITATTGASLSLDPELTAAVLAHGIRITIRGHALELHFPALGTDVTPKAPA